jgi:tRNA(Ile)-lysidine synthase TilS/MesJ
MQCSICGREGYFYSTYLKQWLCKKHFEKMIVRRIRRNVINNGYYANSYTIDLSLPASKILMLLFKQGTGPILYAHTLEDFVEEVLAFFFLNKKPSFKVKGEGYFNPLYNCSREELLYFAKLKEIELHFDNKLEFADFMEELEKRRPGSKISIVESAIKLGII